MIHLLLNLRRKRDDEEMLLRWLASFNLMRTSFKRLYYLLLEKIHLFFFSYGNKSILREFGVTAVCLAEGACVLSGGTGRPFG